MKHPTTDVQDGSWREAHAKLSYGDINREMHSFQRAPIP
jgi:hypothetical protein